MGRGGWGKGAPTHTRMAANGRCCASPPHATPAQWGFADGIPPAPVARPADRPRPRRRGATAHTVTRVAGREQTRFVEEVGGGGASDRGVVVSTLRREPPRPPELHAHTNNRAPPAGSRSSHARPLQRHPSQGRTWHALNDDRRLRRQLTAYRRTRYRRSMEPPGGPSAATSWRPQGGGGMNTTQGASVHCPLGWRG